jgi:hypothetical protein
MKTTTFTKEANGRQFSFFRGRRIECLGCGVMTAGHFHTAFVKYGDNSSFVDVPCCPVCREDGVIDAVLVEKTNAPEKIAAPAVKVRKAKAVKSGKQILGHDVPQVLVDALSDEFWAAHEKNTILVNPLDSCKVFTHLEVRLSRQKC